jgi:hypothetical protein
MSKHNKYAQHQIRQSQKEGISEELNQNLLERKHLFKMGNI